MKLVEKKLTGSKIAKTYDHPKTPCDRILARDQVSEETKQLLRAKQEALDPMKLSAVIETVTAMDVLVPGIGEIIGGSQREERLDVLLGNFAKHGLDPEAYDWYTDLRKYGSVPHAGFGLGFERLLMFVTGMTNIRDVIPFARTPGHCEF